MVPAGNKGKRLSSVNHTTETIHHHHHHHHQLPVKAGRWGNPLTLRDLAKANPIIIDNALPFLTENNFQTPPPSLLSPPSPVYWYLGYLLPPPFIKTPYLEPESTEIFKRQICKPNSFFDKRWFLKTWVFEVEFAKCCWTASYSVLQLTRCQNFFKSRG